LSLVGEDEPFDWLRAGRRRDGSRKDAKPQRRKREWLMDNGEEEEVHHRGARRRGAMAGRAENTEVKKDEG